MLAGPIMFFETHASSRLLCGAMALVLLLVSACRHEDSAPARPTAPSAAAERSTEPAAPPSTIRPPALVEDGWYSGDAAELEGAVTAYLDGATAVTVDGPMALVAPHAGHRWSGPTAGAAYKTVRDHAYARVFVLAPAHRVALRGMALPTVDAFASPLGEVMLDRAVIERLAQHELVVIDDGPHAEEHAVEIQLPFLQVALQPGFRLVPVVVGNLELEEVRELGALLREQVGPNDLVVASSDFTHYGRRFGYTPFVEKVPWNLKVLDMGAFEQIAAMSLDGFWRYRADTGVTICGFLPIALTMAMLPSGSRAKLLAYDTSGRITNDYGSSVSYVSIALSGPGWGALDPSLAPMAPVTVEYATGPAVLSPREQQEALTLARGVLETFVRTGRAPTAAQLGVEFSDVMREAYGVFVTLKKHGELRGCIGNIRPVAPLAEGIVGRTVSAAAHDQRFRPVTADELDVIEVEISVLTRPTPIGSPSEIVIGRHGVVLEKAGKRSVFLPQVAPERGWDVEQTLTQLSLKAGLSGDAWRSGAALQVFEAQVFHE